MALIIEILYLKRNFFQTESCLSVFTTSTSHMRICFKIDLGLIKLSNVQFLSESRSLFGDYHEMAHVWARIQAIDQVFKIRTIQTSSFKYYAKD